MARVRFTLMLGSVILATTAMAAEELDRLPLGDPERAYEQVSAPAGGFFDTRSGGEISFDELVQVMAGARVVLLGEEHTAMDQKRTQARILEALAARDLHLVLGMEFFQREDSEVLDRWLAGEIDGDDFLLDVGWYDRGGYRFEYYDPIMEVARAHGIPVVGLNVPRSLVRAVSMGGLDGLSEEQRTEVGDVETGGSPGHRYLITRYFGDTVAQLPPAWLDNMYAAQCVWDVVMARSILADLPADATMVVVVGAGHVAYDLGIARRIHEERAVRGEPDLPVVTYCPVSAPAPDPEGEPTGHPMGSHSDDATEEPRALFSRSLADLVAAFPADGGIEAFPRLGFKLDEDEDGGVVVSMVWPDTTAEAAGFASGDRILDVNGVVPEDLAHLRLRLAEIEWGQRLDLRVERDGTELDVPVLLEPAVAVSETELAPGYAVSELAEFEPASAAGYTGEEPAPDAPHRHVLVTRDERPVRVEVWHEDTLTESHHLDDQGRVRVSLYLHPWPDGTVEIRYRRDESGEVVSTARYDRGGEVIAAGP